MILFFSTKDYCIFWWLSYFTWQYWTLCFRYGTSSNDIKWYDMIRCLPSHIHWHTPCCTGSEAWLLHWSNSALAVGCSVPSETQWYHHNCTVIYIYNWVNHCTMEPMMESFKSSFRSFPHLQLLQPTMEMACDTGHPHFACMHPFSTRDRKSHELRSPN